MSKKDKPVSAKALAEGQDSLKKVLAYLEQNKSTPVNIKETERRLAAMWYDLTVVCPMRGWSPLKRLETFRNLGYMVP